MHDIVAIAEASRFAAHAHAAQRRKGARGEPYVNHLAEVACLVAQATQGKDVALVVAAWLHDTVEDQGVTENMLSDNFGADVAALVLEVTDDKGLPKEIRKRLQVENVVTKSRRARLLKLADKTSNVTALADSPPAGWSRERLVEYVRWAKEVVDRGCRDLNDELEAKFDAAVERALASFEAKPSSAD